MECSLSVRSSNCAAVVNICGGSWGGPADGRTGAFCWPDDGPKLPSEGGR